MNHLPPKQKLHIVYHGRGTANGQSFQRKNQFPFTLKLAGNTISKPYTKKAMGVITYRLRGRCRMVKWKRRLLVHGCRLLYRQLAISVKPPEQSFVKSGKASKEMMSRRFRK